jgi:hypothetical protein
MKKAEDKDKSTQPNVIIVKDVRSMYDQTFMKVTSDPWMGIIHGWVATCVSYYCLPSRSTTFFIQYIYEILGKL